MKLRIRGNSLRLRLTRTEVAAIGRGETVRESISFSPTSRLDYVLESASGPDLRATFESASIRVAVPLTIAREWASSKTISVKAQQDIGTGGRLQLLIEKDFTCLKPREHQHEDESDLFPNPNEEHGHCGGA
jgi:hypothetical protein